MGSFVHAVEATSPKEAYESLCAEHRYNRGHSAYNGTISTCDMGRCVKKFDSPTENNIEQAYTVIEQKDGGLKGVADYIELGISKYLVITAKKEITKKSEPKFKVKYVVKETTPSNNYSNKKHSYDTKAEAEKEAITLALKNCCYYDIKKEYILESGDSKISTIKLETKEYKSKPNLKFMDNKKIVEMHKYIFYGWGRG